MSRESRVIETVNGKQWNGGTVFTVKLMYCYTHYCELINLVLISETFV